jgi:hypothetical protein
MQGNDQNEDPDYKPFTDKELVKYISIAFVFVIYLFMFLKILILN